MIEESEVQPEMRASSSSRSIATFSWKKSKFRSSSYSAEELVNPSEVISAWSYLGRYLEDSFSELCANHTSLYYLQKNGKELKLNLTAEELRNFLECIPLHASLWAVLNFRGFTCVGAKS